MDRKAFDRINYGLFLVGSAGASQPQGCIVNSLHQITSSMPPMFSMTINKSSETCKAIEASGAFSATVLSHDAPKELIDQFGYKSGRAGNKFAQYDCKTDEGGSPYITDGALVRFSFQVKEKLEVGNFILYVAQATQAETLAEGKALTLDALQDRGASAPAAATVVRTMDEHEGWRCTICGYVALKDELPEGYKCPICRADRDKFVKL